MDASALLYLVAAGASAGIAVLLYPVLKGAHATLALGAVVFRCIEAVFYMVGVVSLLTIGTLSEQAAASPASDLAPTYAMADALQSVHDHSSLVAVLAFSVAALMYYVAFYQSGLVPRWLSGWGIAAVPLMILASLLALFSDSAVTGYVPLFLPIASQELVLAVWLLVKGFNPAALPQAPRMESS